MFDGEGCEDRETTVSISELRKVRIDAAKYRRELRELRAKLERERLHTVENNSIYGIVLIDESGKVFPYCDIYGEMITSDDITVVDDYARDLEVELGFEECAFIRVVSLKGVEE